MVSLELFKQHVRADDIIGEDELLAFYLNGAEKAIVRATNRTYEELFDMGGGELPEDLVMAIFALAASWVAHKESVSTVQMYSVPDSYLSLVKPFRKLVDDAGG